MTPELGTIEGFYGQPWSWEARAAHVSALAPHGYRFYLYAPKADAFLRRRWAEPHPDGEIERLASLAAHCRAEGVRFGVGLSPYELYLGFDEVAREALALKLHELDDIGIDDLAILFDDMRGDLPGLAEKQIEIVDFAAERSKAGRLIVCPSYYTDDPILDRVFGERPAGYLETLGALDPAIEVFWTGPRVCSKEIGVEHLVRTGETLGRKPFIWDNYPVNDGQRMSPFLHLRGFTGRDAEIGGFISAHGVNPASQPCLSRIPMLTLETAYAGAGTYDAGAAFRAAAEAVAGPELARLIEADLYLLQDKGLDGLSEKETAALRNRYAAVGNPCAREIVQWLDGHWRITNETVLTQ